MYRESAQGIDERMINVHYYYIKQCPKAANSNWFPYLWSLGFIQK